MTRTWTVALIALLCSPDPFAAAAPNLEAEGELLALKLTKESLPEGWRLSREVSATEAQLPAFERKFGAKIKAMTTQLLESDAGKVQLNYVAFLLPEELVLAYRRMQSAAQGRVTVLACGRVVLEIGATTEALKATATDWFPLDALQATKIKQHQVAGEWRLVEESLFSETELRALAGATGVELVGGLTQMFAVRQGKPIRLTMWQPAETNQLERLRGALLRNADGRSRFFTAGACLVQFIGEGAGVRRRVEGLLSANAAAHEAKSPKASPDEEAAG